MPASTETTERANVHVPKPMVEAARERYPELTDVPLGKVLRFVLALALGKTREQAMEATRDARTLRKYV